MLAAFPGWVFARESQWLKKKKKEKQKTKNKQKTQCQSNNSDSLLYYFVVSRKKAKERSA